MEVERYASRGVANTALGLGIGAVALEAIGGNLIGGLFGKNESTYSKYDAEKDAKIARLETEVMLRDANTFTMGEMGKLRDYVDGELKDIRGELCAQKVFNEKTMSGLGCLTGQVNGLQALLNSITKTVVPNGAICPGWGDVTVSITPATTPTTGA